jgi:hypothetical protein
MNGQVKEALNIPSNVIWGSQANAVFDYLSEDFMKPVTHIGQIFLNLENCFCSIDPLGRIYY